MPSCAAVVASLGLPAPSHCERMPGYDAIVWRAVVGGETVAVRMLRSGRSAEGEVAALELAASVTALAPHVLATGSHDGCAAIVMSWCAGRRIVDLLADGADVDVLGEMFGAAHARLNATGVCHMDFQPFNVLSDGVEVTGIVDWTNACRADPRIDVARTRVILELAPVLSPDQPVDAFTDAWARGYASVGTLPDDRELAPFLAAASARQADDWHRRADVGEASPSVAAAAEAIAQRWPDA